MNLYHEQYGLSSPALHSHMYIVTLKHPECIIRRVHVAIILHAMHIWNACHISGEVSFIMTSPIE